MAAAAPKQLPPVCTPDFSHARASGRFHSGAACFHFSFTPPGVFSRSRAADAGKVLLSFHGSSAALQAA
jgi:hypothetical protein